MNNQAQNTNMKLSYKLSTSDDWKDVEIDDSFSGTDDIASKIAELETIDNFENASLTFFLDKKEAWKAQQLESNLQRFKEIHGLQGQVRTFDGENGPLVKYSHVVKASRARELANEFFSL